MKLSTKTSQTMTLLAFLILVMVIICLCLELAQAWRNERFLDAELNKHTTTHNPEKQ